MFDAALWLALLLAPEEDLLRAADAPRHVLSEGVIRLQATVTRPGEPSTASALEVYVQEPDRALCVFRDGPFAGRRILLDGARVSLLLPDTTHPVRVSPNQRLFGGASIADVARLRFAADFTGKLEPGEQTIDGVVCRALKLSGRGERAAYAAGTLWVGARDQLPRRAVLTLPSGKPAKELRFAAYADEGGRKVLRRLEIHHLLAAEQGMITTLEFLAYEPRKLPEGAFDPQHGRDVLP